MTSLAVLVPAYNAEKEISQFWRSLNTQTRAPDRILVYDDGSTDRTREMLSRWSKSDSRVRVLASDVNNGRGYARQALIEAAETEFVAWLDMDDSWHPRKLEVQHREYSALSVEGPAKLIASPVVQLSVRNGGSKTIAIPRCYTLNDYLSIARQKNSVVMLQSVFGRTRDFKNVGFDPELNWSEDFDFILRYLGHGGVIIPQCDETAPAVYRHDIRGRNPDQIVKSHDYLYKKNLTLWPNETEARLEKFLRRLNYIIYAYVANGDAEGAEHVFLEATRTLEKYDAYKERINNAAQSVLKCYRNDPENYVRFFHAISNRSKNLQIVRVSSGYKTESTSSVSVRWKCVTGHEATPVGDVSFISDDEVFRLYLEGFRRIYAVERREKGIKREFRIEVVAGGAIVLLPLYF